MLNTVPQGARGNPYAVQVLVVLQGKQIKIENQVIEENMSTAVNEIAHLLLPKGSLYAILVMYLWPNARHCTVGVLSQNFCLLTSEKICEKILERAL